MAREAAVGVGEVAEAGAAAGVATKATRVVTMAATKAEATVAMATTTNPKEADITDRCVYRKPL